MVVATQSHHQRAPGGGGIPTYSSNSPSKNELDDIDVIPKGKVLNGINNFSSSTKSISPSNLSPTNRSGWSPRAIQTRNADNDKVVVAAVNKQKDVAVVTPTGSKTIGDGRYRFPSTHGPVSGACPKHTRKVNNTLQEDCTTEIAKSTVPITPDEKARDVPAPAADLRSDMQTKGNPKHRQRNNDEAIAPHSMGTGTQRTTYQNQIQLQTSAGYVPTSELGNNTQTTRDPSQNINTIDQNLRAVTTMRQSTTNVPKVNQPRQNTGACTPVQQLQNQVNVADSQPRNDTQHSSRNTTNHLAHSKLNSQTTTAQNPSKQEQYRIPKETSPFMRARSQQVHHYGHSKNSVDAPGRGRSPLSRTPSPMQAHHVGITATPPDQQFPQTISPIITTPTQIQGFHHQRSNSKDSCGNILASTSELPQPQSSGSNLSQPEISPLTRTPNTTGQHTDPSTEFGSDVEFVDYGQHSPSTYDTRSFREFESKIVKSMKTNFKEDTTTDADSMTSINEDDYSYDTSRYTDASSYYSTRYEFVENSIPLSNLVDYLFDDNSLIASDESSCRRPRRRNRRQSSKSKKAEAPNLEKQSEKKVPKKAPRKPPIQKKQNYRRNNSSNVSVKTESSRSVKSEDGWDRLEYTVDDLAFELAKQNRHQENRNTRILAPMRSRIVERFKKKLPDLYGQVQGKIEEKTSNSKEKQSLETNDNESEPIRESEREIAISNLPELINQVEQSEADERLNLEAEAPFTSQEERAPADGDDAKNSLSVNGGDNQVTSTEDDESEDPQAFYMDVHEPLDHAEYEQMGAALENSERMRESDLDSMIEDFLTSKIQTLSSKGKEQNQSGSRRDRILAHMKQRRADSNKSIVHTQTYGAEVEQCTEAKDDPVQNNMSGVQRLLSTSSVLDAAQPPTITKLKPPNNAIERRAIPRRCGDTSHEQCVPTDPDARDFSAVTLALGAGGDRKRSDEEQVSRRPSDFPPESASQISQSDTLRSAKSEPSSIFRLGPLSEDPTSMTSSNVAVQGSEYESSRRPRMLDSETESCALSTEQEALQGSSNLDGASLVVNKSLTSQDSFETGWDNEERTLNDFVVEKSRSVVEKIRAKRLSRAAIYASSDPGVRGDHRNEEFAVAASDIVTSFRSEAGVSAPANEISSARRAAVVAYLRDRCISPFAAQSDNGTMATSPQDIVSSRDVYATEESSVPSQFRELTSLADSVSDNRSDSASYMSNEFVRFGLSSRNSDVGHESAVNESVTQYSDVEERTLLDEYVRRRTAILKLISPTNHADLSFDVSENAATDEQTTMTSSATASHYDWQTVGENQGHHDSESGTLTGSVEADLADFLTRGTHLEIKTKKKKKNKTPSRDSSSSSFVPRNIDAFDDHLETLHEASSEASDTSQRDKGDHSHDADRQASPWSDNRDPDRDRNNMMAADTWHPSSNKFHDTPPNVKSAGSFCDSELSARDLLRTLSPPSPESPIRDYEFFHNGGSVAASEAATAGDDVAALKKKKNKKPLIVVATTQHTAEGLGGGALTACSSISESVSTFQPQSSDHSGDNVQRQLADKFLEVSIDPSGIQRRISPNSVTKFGGGDGTAPLESIVDDHDSRTDLFFVDEEDEGYVNNSSFISDTDIIDGRFFEI